MFYCQCLCVFIIVMLEKFSLIDIVGSLRSKCIGFTKLPVFVNTFPIRNKARFTLVRHVPTDTVPYRSYFRHRHTALTLSIQHRFVFNNFTLYHLKYVYTIYELWFGNDCYNCSRRRGTKKYTTKYMGSYNFVKTAHRGWIRYVV